MNKETRSFIWGVILVLVCGTGTAIGISKIIDGTFKILPDAILIFFTLCGVVSGAIRLHKSVD